MSTLTDLKADIADDLQRSDLTDAIADAISRAIRHYQAEHFYFNESRDKTFSCVVGQTWYTGSDDADIPLFTDIDMVHITIGSNRYQLREYDIQRFEILTDGNASNGQPYAYTYYNQSIGLYVPPDDTYTVRIIGAYKAPEPATDGETDNVWMTEAYQLIRSHATSDVAARKIRNFELAAASAQGRDIELNRIRQETARRVKTNRVTPNRF